MVARAARHRPANLGYLPLAAEFRLGLPSQFHDIDCSPIGLGHDFRHSSDLPQRSLAERPDSEKAAGRLSVLPNDLSSPLHHDPEAMGISEREILREQVPDQWLIEIRPET
jgi:hypothetical protein